jgi:hypothetical protein
MEKDINAFEWYFNEEGVLAGRNTNVKSLGSSR